ncbi:hypothetical protein ETB97_009452 [Aspergillus alliaceus]|uniref:Uncharacterized protein n=1 Tax=Petromyces alliaceus TaxID=209559 RepID=A0A8H6E1K4_PETAA|nr:hypothetical protein ETB97_009452 [Aspergillus burnettii]
MHPSSFTPHLDTFGLLSIDFKRFVLDPHHLLALANGDQILGIVAGSNVYQDENCTPITVPNALSLSDLFCDKIG